MKNLLDSLIIFYLRLLMILSLLIIQSCNLNKNSLNSKLPYDVRKLTQTGKQLQGIIKKKKITVVRIDEPRISLINDIFAPLVGELGGETIGYAVAGLDGQLVGSIVGPSTVSYMVDEATIEKQKMLKYIVHVSVIDPKSGKIKTGLISITQNLDNNLNVGDKVNIVVTKVEGKKIVKLVRIND